MRLEIGHFREASRFQADNSASEDRAVSIYRARKEEIAIVLTDMMMPGMDGSATIRQMKQLNPKVRIVAASGVLTDERVGTAAEAGAVAFLRKPYSAEVLLRTFHQVLTAGGA